MRHALPERVERDDGGAADPSLSAHGRRQAEAVGEVLADEPLDVIITSPLRRARETAASIAIHHALEPVVVPGVSEYDADAAAYVPIEELTPEEYRAMVAEWAQGAVMEPFFAQVAEAMHEIVLGHRGKTVAVVCHGGVINATLRWMLGVQGTMVFDPTYTSLTRVRTNGAVHTVRTVGEAGHLRGL